MTEPTQAAPREEIEVGGHQLVEKVKHLLREGNIRQLRIIAEDGDVKLEVPMTLGVIAGGAVALAAPWLAIIAVVAALVKHVRIVVERDEAPAAAADPTASTPPVLPEPARVA